MSASGKTPQKKGVKDYKNVKKYNYAKEVITTN